MAFALMLAGCDQVQMANDSRSEPLRTLIPVGQVTVLKDEHGNRYATRPLGGVEYAIVAIEPTKKELAPKGFVLLTDSNGRQYAVTVETRGAATFVPPANTRYYLYLVNDTSENKDEANDDPTRELPTGSVSEPDPTGKSIPD